MENLHSTVKYKGHTIKIYYDDDPQSPDEWGNDDVFLVYEHRDFCIKRPGFDPEEIFETFQKKNMFEGFHIFPVYAYIHSGVALSLGRNTYPFTCPWDTSFKGFALVKRQKGYWKREKAFEIAQSLIKEWNQCLSGEVFGYNSDCGSCWGFYGEEEIPRMIEEAKAEIDAFEKEKQAKIDALQYKIEFSF